MQLSQYSFKSTVKGIVYGAVSILYVSLPLFKGWKVHHVIYSAPLGAFVTFMMT
jgi:hypothetical protein